MTYRTVVTPIIIIILVSTLPAFGAFWDVEPVYSGGFASGDVSLAVDGDNVPSVSYTANGILCLAVKNLMGWHQQQIASVGFWGGLSSHAYSPNGHAAVAFIDASDPMVNRLRFAFKPSGSWVTETVENDVGWSADHLSLAYNSLGQPCIVYCKTTGTYPDFVTYVSFARRIGPNSWVKENIAQIGFSTGPAMVIEGDKYTVAFADSDSGQLKIATKVGSGSWQIIGIDGSPASPVIWDPAMTLQANGNPAAAYFVGSVGSVSLKYARSDGSSWKSEVAVELPSEGVYNCSVAVTPGGIPLIGYCDPGAECFKNAWKAGGVWVSETIDAAYQAGLRSDFVLDGLGNIATAYFDNFGGNIKFAWAIIPRSTTEAKSLPDGSTCQISGVVASNEGGELGNRIYVQEKNRSSGIQLHFSVSAPPVTRGMLLDIQGSIVTIDEERAILDPYLAEIDSGEATSEPCPLFMRNSSIGGGDFRYSIGSSEPDQRGVTGGTGLNNIGLLVRTAGQVKSTGTGTFTIDDGSDVMLRVEVPPEVALPDLYSYVVVTGASSCEPDNDDLIRLIRVRTEDDIGVLIVR